MNNNGVHFYRSTPISDMKKVLTEGKAHAAAVGSMFVYYGREKAVLITAPNEEDLYKIGIYSRCVK